MSTISGLSTSCLSMSSWEAAERSGTRSQAPAGLQTIGCIVAAPSRSSWKSARSSRNGNGPPGEETHARLAAQLEPRVKNRRFLLHLEATLERSPSVTRLAAEIDRFLAGLDPDDIPNMALGVGQDLPRMPYREVGVLVTVEAVPIRRELLAARRDDDRIIVSGPLVGGLVDSGRRLKRSLSKKLAAAYDIPQGIPYIIAAGIHDPFCSVEQIQTALYGPDLLATRRWDPLNDALGPSRQGLFGMKLATRHHQNTRISAVACLWMKTWKPQDHQLLLFENPAAELRASANVFPFTSRLGPNTGSDWTWHAPEGSS
jgi:hypothetical protein